MIVAQIYFPRHTKAKYAPSDLFNGNTEIFIPERFTNRTQISYTVEKL